MRVFTFYVPRQAAFRCEAPDRDTAVMNANAHYGSAVVNQRGAWQEADDTGKCYDWKAARIFP